VTLRDRDVSAPGTLVHSASGLLAYIACDLPQHCHLEPEHETSVVMVPGGWEDWWLLDACVQTETCNGS
jgi:hypothetical protein